MPLVHYDSQPTNPFSNLKAHCTFNIIIVMDTSQLNQKEVTFFYLSQLLCNFIDPFLSNPTVVYPTGVRWLLVYNTCIIYSIISDVLIYASVQYMGGRKFWHDFQA